MGEISYKARTRDGKLVNGRAAGDSVDQVAQRLISTGVTTLENAPLGVVGNSLDIEK